MENYLSLVCKVSDLLQAYAGNISDKEQQYREACDSFTLVTKGLPAGGVTDIYITQSELDLYYDSYVAVLLKDLKSIGLNPVVELVFPDGRKYSCDIADIHEFVDLLITVIYK